MSNRFVFIFGCILLLFPYVRVFSEWKMWTAFAIGLLFIISALYGSMRKSKKKSV